MSADKQRTEGERRVLMVEAKLAAGHPPPGVPHGNATSGAVRAAATEDNRARGSSQSWFESAVRWAGREPDWSKYQPRATTALEPPEGQTTRGVSTLHKADGTVKEYWNKTVRAGREDDEVVRLPDPKTITKISTLRDPEGKITYQWVQEKPADKSKEALWMAFAQSLAEPVKRAKVRKPPERLAKDMMAVVPVGDHHIGMYAWAKETGADYDVKIAEQMLCDATDHLMAATQPCGTALIALMGDFFHYDSFETVTPTSRNALDSDTRFPEMVAVGVRCARYMIDAALKRHGNVQVIVEIGNHDLTNSIFLAILLDHVYEDEPRVTIDTSPRHFHYFRFGKVLIGTHHGQGRAAKAEDLPEIMAHDCADIWSETAHRHWFTGHIHKKTMSDARTCTVESVRILPPADAWATNTGYRSQRDMQAIEFHREHGEASRYRVTPGMLA